MSVEHDDESAKRGPSPSTGRVLVTGGQRAVTPMWWRPTMEHDTWPGDTRLS
jgi:hypothetical protein